MVCLAGDIEDEQIKQILNKLNINPQTFNKSLINSGGQDSLNEQLIQEAGPQDRGKTISDAQLLANGKPYYPIYLLKIKLEIIYIMGGTVSSNFPDYNKEDSNKIEFDGQNKFNSE